MEETKNTNPKYEKNEEEIDIIEEEVVLLPKELQECVEIDLGASTIIARQIME